MPRKALCKQDRKRSHQDNHQTDFPVQHQHEQQRSNQREHPCKQLCKAHQQPICKLVNVCNDTADRFAGWMSENWSETEHMRTCWKPVRFIRKSIILSSRKRRCRQMPKKTDKEPQNWKRIWQMIRPYRGWMIASMVLAAFTVAFTLYIPISVNTPVNSCVKPISNPSANWSTSVMTRLTVSPVGCRSRLESGSF